MSKIRPLAIYLPQFHPIPENDKWWGKGFTEWTNVTQAKPRFKGHNQPRIPSDLGFYDLRLIETMQEQINLAKQHGIYGFCFYHYWFAGKWYLEKPLFNLLKHKEIDLPYCFCWANGDWVRSWQQKDEKILLKQEYSPEYDKKHIRELFQFFVDPRYIKIDGKPVFIIYRSELFPDIRHSIEIYRKEAKKYGFDDLYIIRVESFVKDIDPYELGFDAAMDFQPDWTRFPTRKNNIISRIRSFFKQSNENIVFEYEHFVENILKREQAEYKRYPCVMPQWDNSPRRENGATIMVNSRPDIFEKWLKHEIGNFNPYSKDENLFFINAWNEWAEGNFMEPCITWGSKYLESFKKIIKSHEL